jgi:hypothetical protein
MTHRLTPTLAPVAGAPVAGLAGAGCALDSDAPLVVFHPDPVAMASTTKAPRHALPPIDRRAPATLETATFALG